MASLASTSNMFYFVLVLYLLGFVAMVTRWRMTEFADGENTELERRDERSVHSSKVQHLEVGVKESSEAVQHDESLKIDKNMPVFNKDNSPESKESPPREREQKSPKASSKKKSVKKARGGNSITKHAFKKDDKQTVEGKSPPPAETPAKNTIQSTERRSKQLPVEVAPGLGVQGEANPRRKWTKTNGKPDKKTLWKADQAKRKDTLRRACNRFDNLGQESNVSEIIKSHKRGFWPFIVEDQYRLIYTFISKVGSTNWKSAFLVLKGKYKTVDNVPGRFAHSPSLIKLSSLPAEGIKQRLDNYTNFIFVRHPFARVLSAYRSKFLQRNRAFQKGTGVRIIKMYRKNATKEALATGSDVTFPEFVRFLANAKLINFDGHWQPMYKMVLPCAVRFDYIGKLETGEDDAKYILQETHVDHLVHFKATKRNVSHDDTIFNHFFSQIPSNDVVKLYKVYEPDFKLFGYEIPDSMKALFKVT